MLGVEKVEPEESDGVKTEGEGVVNVKNGGEDILISNGGFCITYVSKIHPRPRRVAMKRDTKKRRARKSYVTTVTYLCLPMPDLCLTHTMSENNLNDILITNSGGKTTITFTNLGNKTSIAFTEPGPRVSKMYRIFFPH